MDIIKIGVIISPWFVGRSLMTIYTKRVPNFNLLNIREKIKKNNNIYSTRNLDVLTTITFHANINA